MNVAVIGAGAAGLSAGYELAKKGIHVTLFERDNVLGGLAGSFLLDGGYVEKFYHFICLHDHTYQEVLRELGLHHLLQWKLTDMGQYYAGKLYSFGRPLDLLFFPGIPFLDKVRFAKEIMKVKRAHWEEWRKIENIPVDDWLLDTFGPNVYTALHEPMVRLKFGKYKKKLSAAWMWARIHRLGKSRTKIRQREKVGYVQGGSQIIMDALGREIQSRGGEIELGSSVEQLIFDEHHVKGLVVNGQQRFFNAVVSTVPLPAFLRLIPETLQGEYWSRLRKIESIGVLCVLLRARKSLSKFFWININDPNIDLAGVIEFTNLNSLPHLGGDSIIYLPQYLPSTTQKFRKSNEEIIQEYVGYLKRINPSFTDKDVVSAFVFREKYAQPICEVGFTKEIPDFRTSLQGLYLTDSSQLHPDDRTISNSLGLGRSASALILEDINKLQNETANVVLGQS